MVRVAVETSINVVPDAIPVRADAQSVSQRRVSLSDDQFRPIPTPEILLSLCWTLIGAMILAALAALYTLNDQHTENSSVRARRGLIVGLMVCLLTGSIDLLWAPPAVGYNTLEKRRFWYFLPLTIGSAIGFACIPIGGSALTMVPIGLCSLGLNQIAYVVLNNLWYRTPEHKTFDGFVGISVFCACVSTPLTMLLYTTLTDMFDNMAVGLIIPASSLLSEFAFLTILKRSYDAHYYRPKSKYLKAKLAREASGSIVARATACDDDTPIDTPRVDVASPTSLNPPIFCDIDAQFGRWIAFGMLLFENAKFCVSFVQLLRSPSSKSWILGSAVSIVVEISKRSGLWNRAEIAIGLPSWGKTTALKVAYYRAAAGVGYMAVALLIGLGCVRAGFLRRWDAIIFLDVSWAMPVLIASQVATELIQDIIVHQLQAKLALAKFVPVDNLDPEHPLLDFSVRHFTLESYVSVFLGGATATMWILTIFLGPGFAFGAQPVFRSSVPDRWLWCNASAWGLDPLGANETMP